MEFTRTDDGFQSTLPVRGATGRARKKPRLSAISIHAPRTGSDGYQLPGYAVAAISIHAPRTGSDGLEIRQAGSGCDFNPRSPYGERRLPPGIRHPQNFISIHAPRTGSDGGHG